VSTDQDFVPLLHAKDHVELEMAKDLLGAAEIPHVVDTSDQYEMLEILEGSSAEGIQVVLVPPDKLDAAVALLEDAWGPEVLATKRVKGKK
jgi:hypothetical protein